MEKKTDKYKTEKEKYLPFLKRIDSWLVNNSRLAMSLFQKYDASDDGVITYDELKSGKYEELSNTHKL